MSIVLICGPVRSGKSRLAEGLAAASGLPVIYLATGPKPDPKTDPEWAERVQQHRQRRPSGWQTWETGRDLGAELQKLPQPCCALVDSLGGWVAQGLDCPSSEWDPLVQSFLATLQSHRGEILLVSEEVGWGGGARLPTGAAVSGSDGGTDPKAGSPGRPSVFGNGRFCPGSHPSRDPSGEQDRAELR